MTFGSQAKSTKENQTAKLICDECHNMTICLIIAPVSETAKSDFQKIMPWHLAYGGFNLYPMRRNHINSGVLVILTFSVYYLD